MATSATSTARRSNATTASGFAKDTFDHFLSCLLSQKASFERGQMSYSSSLVPKPPYICCHLSSFVSFALISYGSGLQKSNQAALKLLSHYSALTACMHLRVPVWLRRGRIIRRALAVFNYVHNSTYAPPHQPAATNTKSKLHAKWR